MQRSCHQKCIFWQYFLTSFNRKWCLKTSIRTFLHWSWVPCWRTLWQTARWSWDLPTGPCDWCVSTSCDEAKCPDTWQCEAAHGLGMWYHIECSSHHWLHRHFSLLIWKLKCVREVYERIIQRLHKIIWLYDSTWRWKRWMGEVFLATTLPYITNRSTCTLYCQKIHTLHTHPTLLSIQQLQKKILNKGLRKLLFSQVSQWWGNPIFREANSFLGKKGCL